jgi:hypothetical protein
VLQNRAAQGRQQVQRVGAMVSFCLLLWKGGACTHAWRHDVPHSPFCLLHDYPVFIPRCTCHTLPPSPCLCGNLVSWVLAGTVDYHFNLSQHFADPHMLVDGAWGVRMGGGVGCTPPWCVRTRSG